MKHISKVKFITIIMPLVFGCLFSVAAFAQVEISVTGATIKGIPTAIVPFKVIDGQVLDHQVHQIVADDLRASGKFEPIAQNNFLSLPSRNEEVNFKDWRFIGAEVLVIGEVWVLSPGKYEVQFRMYDIARKEQIGQGKRISNLSSRDLRTAAHVVSDHVYTAFTGRGAVFNSRIAYVKRSEVEAQRYRYRLMVADWDGFGEAELYASWKPVLSPAWSPDNRQLAFVTYATGGPIIKVVNLQTRETSTIAKFKGVNSAPAWSPDGSKIAYSTSRHGSPDVYVYDLVTQQHKRINKHYGIDTEPAWSPDGTSLLFTSNRNSKPQIYSIGVQSQTANRLTFEGKENANASYDFEGRKITMVHEGGQIVVMDKESGEFTWLTNGEFDESPSFSPNGDMVLYKTEQNFQPALMVASSDGRVRTRLQLVNGDVREPAWSSLRK